MTDRITGYDLARGLAVFGMFLMNFKLVMQSPLEQSDGFWAMLLQVWEGRFGVLFIVLAGIGVSLMTKKARLTRDRRLISARRRTLLLRAGFLFAAGLAYQPVWEADILHYYGIYIACGVAMLNWSNRSLLAVMAVCTLTFPGLCLVFNWETGWDWQTLSYTDFWSVPGFVRNTLFNGFHPVFPWLSFFVLGMLTGRMDLGDAQVRKRLLQVSGVLVVACELGSRGLAAAVTDPELGLLFSTLAFPPFPLFVVSAGASSLVLIIACIILTRIVAQKWLDPFIQTGRMVLTHYVAHVIVGMVGLEMAGKLYNQPLRFAVLFSLAYFSLSVLFSVAWARKFGKGPLETVMRRISR